MTGGLRDPARGRVGSITPLNRPSPEPHPPVHLRQEPGHHDRGPAVHRGHREPRDAAVPAQAAAAGPQGPRGQRCWTCSQGHRVRHLGRRRRQRGESGGHQEGEGQARYPKDTARSLSRGLGTGQWVSGPALQRLSAPRLSLGAVLPWGCGGGGEHRQRWGLKPSPGANAGRPLPQAERTQGTTGDLGYAPPVESVYEPLFRERRSGLAQ